MTLTVLLTLDGSDKDERALAVAAALVELADGSARVLRVFDAGHESRTDTENSVRDASARLRAQVDRDIAWEAVEGADVAATLLQYIEERLRDRGGSAEVHVVESADPGAVIVDAVRDDLVEMIAMTTRGAGGLRRMALGSVAEYVVRHSEIPVLLVTARAMAPL